MVMTIPEQDAQRDWHFRQLKWALQALAAAGSAQQALFPEQAVSADDLAFAFAHWATVIRDVYADDLPAGQMDALDAIETKLATMSRDGAEFDLELWTETALRSSDHWSEIRTLAANGLEAFGWSIDSARAAAADRGAAAVR